MFVLKKSLKLAGNEKKNGTMQPSLGCHIRTNTIHINTFFPSNHNIHMIIKVRPAFFGGLQLKGLKPKNKGHTNFYETVI